MPHRSEWVDPEEALTYHGTTVYHTYKEDEWANGPWTYWFTMHADAGEGSGFEFDVRELPEWSVGHSDTNADRITETLQAAIINGKLKNGRGKE